MGIVSQKDQQTIRNLFGKEIKEPVKLVYYTQGEPALDTPGHECMYCRETREMLEEVSGQNEQVSLEVHDFVGESDLALTEGIGEIPAVEIKGKAKGRVRFFGIPSGYEFSTLIEDIVDVSRGRTRLSEATRAELAKITTPVHIRVFVTPT
jgi:thiol-disulfide isomerase/thioredoxin